MASIASSFEDPAVNPLFTKSVDEDVESLPSEETPLLSDGASPGDTPDQSFRRRVLVMCVVFIIIVEVSQYIMEPPLQKIMEDIICRNYHPDHMLRMPTIQDERCKNPDVQKTLAMVRGWSASAEMAARKSTKPCVVSDNTDHLKQLLRRFLSGSLPINMVAVQCCS